MVEVCGSCKKQKPKCECVKKADSSHNDLQKNISNFDLRK